MGGDKEENIFFSSFFFFIPGTLAALSYPEMNKSLLTLMNTLSN